MTNAEKRSRAVASIVTDHAKRLGIWNEEAESQLIAALNEIQDNAALERVGPLLPLLKLAAREVRPCAKCSAQLAFMRTASGKVAPVDLATGLNHFANCPKADEFRRQG